MNIIEYNKVKNFSYQEYLAYLKAKYGTVPYKYGSTKNKKSGLFIHHDKEDCVAALSHSDNRKTFPEYQMPQYLTYCDYLEHVLLHILIGTKTAAVENLGLDGAERFLLPALRNYFNYGIVNPNWDADYYTLIKEDRDVYELLIDRYNALIHETDKVLDINVVLYEQAAHLLDTKNKCLVVLGTGLGKTTTALQYLQDHNCQALVVVPTNTIRGTEETEEEKGSGWLRHSGVDEKGNPKPIAKILTYIAFANTYMEEDYSKYGLVILDEAHHAGYDDEKEIGAKVWSQGVQFLIDNNIKVLGLTATPERSDGIDISETLFKDCTCEGYTIEDAISLGIVNPFSLVTSIYDLQGIKDELDALKKKIAIDDKHTKRLIGHLDLELNKMPSIVETLRTYIAKCKTKRRGIVFIQTIDTEEANNVEKAMNVIQTAFPHAVCKALHSKLSLEEQEKNRKWFNDKTADADKDKYLLTVNMVSEGAHYEDINTLIMFRTTKSYLVYSQQLGRIITLTAYNKPGIDMAAETIVFDFVNNIENVSYNSRKVKKTGNNRNKDLLKVLCNSQAAKSGQIIIQNEVSDFIKKMKELKEYADDIYEDWEIEIIKTYYPIEGPAGCQRRIDEYWEQLYPGSLTT